MIFQLLALRVDCRICSVCTFLNVAKRMSECKIWRKWNARSLCCSTHKYIYIYITVVWYGLVWHSSIYGALDSVTWTWRKCLCLCVSNFPWKCLPAAIHRAICHRYDCCGYSPWHYVFVLLVLLLLLLSLPLPPLPPQPLLLLCWCYCCCYCCWHFPCSCSLVSPFRWLCNASFFRCWHCLSLLLMHTVCIEISCSPDENFQ